ncbi:MAG TPA: hypothetical protein VGC87_10545 [Pyrinomonadaceae bacterium]|jgi:hypothetical protein
MTKRRTEITVETERLLVAERRTTTRVWCARCGTEAEAAACSEEDSTDGAARSAGPHKAGADAGRGSRSRAEQSTKNFQGS